MSEPLKPRIDFSGPLDVEQNAAFKAQQMFNETEAQTFSPATVDEPLEDEGQAEAVIDAALRPKRSLWRKMVMGGLALFGVSVVAQGVQWTMNAWQTQDWVALGGCAAGALIIGAGVDQWRPNGVGYGDCVSARTSAMKREICSTAMEPEKAVHFVKSWRSRRASISLIRHCSAGMPQFMKRRTIVKWLVCTPIWCSRCWMRKPGVRLAVQRQNPH